VGNYFFKDLRHSLACGNTYSYIENLRGGSFSFPPEPE
jgi:hypothetical protein